MNKFRRSLERIKTRVEPGESWTEEDWDHYKTIIEALEAQIPEKEREKSIDWSCF